jgi:hypothetical protein
MTNQATVFENANTVKDITAHYQTPSGLQRTKSFTDVASYSRWERSVERMGYTISALDTSRDPRAGEEFRDFVGPIQMRQIRNLMSGKKVWESMDTPWSCSVASETYWSS